MKKIFKKFTGNTILFLIIVLNTNIVYAQENKEIRTTANEAVYDISIGGTQTFEIMDKQNKIIYITVEELKSPARISNGTYKVSYLSPGAWQASYQVDISSNKISRAHSPSYTVISGEIKQTNLVKESSTKTSYYLIYYNGIIGIQTGVRATISGNSLKVTQI